MISIILYDINNFNKHDLHDYDTTSMAQLWCIESWLFHHHKVLCNGYILQSVGGGDYPLKGTLCKQSCF